MRYNQKKNGNNCIFVMQKERLEYHFKDKEYEFKFKIDYDRIPFDWVKTREKNTWLRNVGILWLIIGLFATVLDFESTGKIIPSFWLILGGGCYLFYYLKQTEFTIFDTSKGRLIIINDKSGKEILSLIDERRSSQIRERYGNINFNNTPNEEINRFEWMEEHGVISEKELAEIKKQIKSKVLGYNEGYLES